VVKEKENARPSSLKLRRVRLELPGASRNPRGHQPADLLALRSCVLPSTRGWVRWRWLYRWPAVVGGLLFRPGGARPGCFCCCCCAYAVCCAALLVVLRTALAIWCVSLAWGLCILPGSSVLCIPKLHPRHYKTSTATPELAAKTS
jgi:hypothetical protein